MENKNLYETVILLDEKLNNEEYKKALEKTKTYFKDCEIKEIEELGKKRLAYEIRKNKNAYYVLISFIAESKEISEIERKYRIDDHILKFIIVRKDY